jgi:hypothetical protein
MAPRWRGDRVAKMDASRCCIASTSAARAAPPAPSPSPPASSPPSGAALASTFDIKWRRPASSLSPAPAPARARAAGARASAGASQTSWMPSATARTSRARQESCRAAARVTSTECPVSTEGGTGRVQLVREGGGGGGGRKLCGAPRAAVRRCVKRRGTNHAVHAVAVDADSASHEARCLLRGPPQPAHVRLGEGQPAPARASA